MHGLDLNDNCRVYDILRKGALRVTKAEWVALAKMFHRAFMNGRDERARQARDVAMSNARQF